MATEAVTDYREQAKLFLAKAWEYLAQGDLHQASEKGWGSAAHMAKAVSEAQGISYRAHEEFNLLLDDVCQLLDSDRPLVLGSVANELHRNYYKRKIHLRGRIIQRQLDSVAELHDLLEPLADG
jgi:hypothetical protein